MDMDAARKITGLTNEMKELVNNQRDTEIDHEKADDILCEVLIALGYIDLVKSYNEVDKWYS